jgi:DnaK suppressor protein
MIGFLSHGLDRSGSRAAPLRCRASHDFNVGLRARGGLTLINRKPAIAFENESTSTGERLHCRKEQPMDLPTQTHLKTLRDLLSYRLAELRAEVHAAELARRESSDAGADEVTDRKDEALQQQLAQVDGTQAQRDLDEAAEVTAALQRLDAGRYGDCVDCGEPIPLQRLLVQPAALRCATCQQAHEHALQRSR